MRSAHKELHKLSGMGWLRAAVLGANDGIVSTASLVVGVASADLSQQAIVATAVAALVAGAMSMATGEYVSVHSQADAEAAALEREKEELRDNPQGELQELAGLLCRRGVSPDLARQVAEQMTQQDALHAHAYEELGISEQTVARPLQAAFASAASFAAGAFMPTLVAIFVDHAIMIPVVAAVSLVSLAILGAIAAVSGGASPLRAAVRVTGWSALAMAVTAGAGQVFSIL